MHDAEIAQEAIEKTHEHENHAEAAGKMGRTRRAAAIVLTLLGATGVVCSMQANDAQTTYLAKTTELSDAWSQYQGKSVRRAIDLAVVDIESHVAANPKDPTIVSDLAGRLKEADRMKSDTAKGDGMEQLSVKAEAISRQREAAEHLHDRVELGTRVVELCAMVTGLALAVESILLLVTAAGAGIVAAAYAIAASAGLL